MNKMIKVYVLDITKLLLPMDFTDVCNIRLNYLNKITDVNRKKQSYYVWKLLLKALSDAGVQDPEFYYKDNVWGVKNENINISLSHSNNLVCVGVSSSFIGVDVERIDDKLLKLKNYFKFEDTELASDEITIDNMAKLWTLKEAKFKNLHHKFYKYFYQLDSLGHNYCICVSTEYDECNYNMKLLTEEDI